MIFMIGFLAGGFAVLITMSLLFIVKDTSFRKSGRITSFWASPQRASLRPPPGGSHSHRLDAKN